ncbi:tubby-like protein [Stylonychia lemnae]|uniref:Tubby-like protein n=1 Tax=Stylonychia lemnae TaxID=5949 RepID=A0A078AN81_STYLE|nr:tubby-like protein [Stylonychia lemnae]|eukprot:CDW83825.1 tubby-like protein [Stylonychia lemnae]
MNIAQNSSNVVTNFSSSDNPNINSFSPLKNSKATSVISLNAADQNQNSSGLFQSNQPVKTINLSKIRFLKGTPQKNNNNISNTLQQNDNDGGQGAGNGNDLQKSMNQSFTFTVKEVQDKSMKKQLLQQPNSIGLNNNLSGIGGQKPRNNSVFKYGRNNDVLLDDNTYENNPQIGASQNSPFKRLTTVNVVQNVVNYNMNSSSAQNFPLPHEQQQAYQRKFSNITQNKTLFQKDFTGKQSAQSLFNYGAEQQNQQPEKEDEDFHDRLNYTINNNVLVDEQIYSNQSNNINSNDNLILQSQQQLPQYEELKRGQYTQNDPQSQNKSNKNDFVVNQNNQNLNSTVVEEYKVEVMNPNKLKKQFKRSNSNENDNKNLDQDSDYDYYSEDETKEIKNSSNVYNTQQQAKQGWGQQQQQKSQKLQPQQRMNNGGSQHQSYGALSSEQEQDRRDTNNDELEGTQVTDPGIIIQNQKQSQNNRFNNDDEQQPPNSSRRLQEVNPNNKARANSTTHRLAGNRRQNPNNMMNAQSRDPLVKNEENDQNQQIIGNTQQPPSRADKNAAKPMKGFDDCFLIKPILETAMMSGQTKRSEDDQDYLRIPGFPLALRNHDSYIQYINMLMYDVGGKSIMMQPIPFEVGMLQFEIQRKKSGFSILHPSFHLYLEKGGDEKVSILFAKKRPFNKTANFLISTEKSKNRRGGEECLGKLRSNENKERYQLFNDGDNPKNMHKVPLQGIRNEHMAIQYKYVPCSIGKLRKAKVIIPGVDPANGKAKEFKPLKKEDTMIKRIEDPASSGNFYAFVDNPPQWNPKTHGYHYDFKGRISEASVKNFQMIPYQDGQKGVNIRGFVAQFGRTNDNVFKLDAQYPFSIFQAFGLALTVFDCE